MKTFDPTNWYWNIGGDQTKVFSSVSGDYVLTSDPTFIAWASDGSKPTNIDTEVNLGGVLITYGIRPTNTSVLSVYQGAQADSIITNIISKVLFNHENRIRVLEGKPTITAAQFKNALVAALN